MQNSVPDGTRTVAWKWIGAAAAAQLLILTLSTGHYGIFRDEFYYLACARHLAWGYVDQPPFSIGVLAAWTKVFGDSVHAIRIPCALAGAGIVVMTGLIAFRLGGGRVAQALAAIVAAFSPAWVAIAGFYSMNVFEVAFWTGAALLLTYIIDTGNPRLWLWMGVLLGVGLLNKISVLVLGVGIAGGLLLTPHRRYLRTKELWIGGAIALAIFLPHVVWQVTHGWPTLEFIANAKRYKIAAFSPLSYFTEQIVLMHPIYFLLWFAGLGYLFYSKRMVPYRIFGWIFVIAFVVMVTQRSKPYYLVAAYAPLIAAGAVALESVARVRARWLRPVAVTLAVLLGLALVPMGAPVLPVDTFIAYQRTIGLAPGTGENNEIGDLPQIFADRFGWEAMAKTVSEVYMSLPEADRSRCVVVAGNYGEAGALEYFSRRYPLPRVASQHNNYYLWGLGNTVPGVVITIGIGEDGLRRTFESVEQAARLDARYARPGESHETIFVARGFKVPPEAAWAAGKHFI